MNKDNNVLFGAIVAIVALIGMAAVSISNENVKIETGIQASNGNLGSALYYSTAQGSKELYTFLSGIIDDLTAVRAPLAGLISTSLTWDPANIASSSVYAVGITTTTVTTAGAAVGDQVLATFDSATSTELWTVSGRVVSASTTLITMVNWGSAALDLTTSTLYVQVLPRSSFIAPSALTTTATSTP